MFNDFKSVDRNKPCQFLGACDWSEINTAGTVDSFLECLYKNLDKALSSCVPLKKVLNLGPQHPWFTCEHDLLNEKTAIRYRRFKRTRIQCDLLWYRAAREQAYEAIESANVLFYHERLKNLHDLIQIWKELRNLGLSSSGLDSPSIFKAEELNTFM